MQILNIHYIQTRGLPGCHHGDDDDGAGRDGVDGLGGESPAVPSIVHAVEFRGWGKFRRLAYRQQCRTSLKATVIHLEYSHLTFFFPFGWKKSPKNKTKKSLQEHLQLTLTKRTKELQRRILFMYRCTFFTLESILLLLRRRRLSRLSRGWGWGSRQEVMGVGRV